MKKIIKHIKTYFPKPIKTQYHEFIKRIERKRYRGGQVYCPICNSKFKIFAPYGKNRRKNAKCIHCGSLERHRLLWFYLNERTNILKETNLKLLHFAPEKIFYYIFSYSANIDYYPCDLFPENYLFSGITKIINVNITEIPFETKTFDVILCNHVLEHIPDDIKAMSELYRVLKDDGWGIFQVPIDYNLEKTYQDFSITTPRERKRVFGLKEHVRLYGKDYKDRLYSVGFDVHEDDYIHKFSPDELFKYGLEANELIYYCKKHKRDINIHKSFD